jgi:hypothetical protein
MQADTVEEKNEVTQSQSQPNSAATPHPFGVLVVGDWLVDEHWVVGKHRAPSSSRTGHEHSRALHREGCSVRSLCGAGQVATILYQAYSGKERPFQVNGIGIWHPADGPILQEMLDPRFNIGRTPHRLAYDEPSKYTQPLPDNLRLHSLTSPLEVVAGTTRIIRIYRHRGDQVDLDQRIDWELPLTEADLAKIAEGVSITVEKLEKVGAAIEHIFVKDLHKGVVSKQLILSLSQNFPHASWYISSKQWDSKWFDALTESQVKLILIPQLAAQKAINEGRMSSASWMTGGGVPSEDAIKEIDRIARKFGMAKIVILPEGMRVLARDGKECYALPTPGVADELPFTPMASVFFPALGAYMIASNLDFFEALKNAVSFTATWEKEESQRTKVDYWAPTAKQELSLTSYIPPPSDLPLWRKFNWETLSREWHQAFSELGVVDTTDNNGNSKKEFQLWRAMTDIRGYVTCIPDKRRHVLTLLRAGRSLKHIPLGDRKAKSFFIVDEPGSGKSFMVERLAATLDMPYLRFNIASLSDKNELPGCFQRISLLQSEHPEAIPIVFFDEMNAKKGQETVYDAFLEPLEDGTYNHDGKTVLLKPCLWIFAGTERPVNQKNRHASDKALDFESRLTHEVMNLNGIKKSDGKQTSNEEEHEEDPEQLEQIYIGVATIRSLFPDVTKISKKVLWAFNIIDSSRTGLPDSLKGPRGIRRFVNSFVYVQYGRVMQSNLPKGWNKQWAVNDGLFKNWEAVHDSEDLLVEIKSRAEG